MKIDKHLGMLAALFVLTGFIAVLGTPAESQAATASSNATAYIVKPIAISAATQDLAFGKFITGAGGTVIVGTDNARVLSGVLPFGTGQAGGGTAASFPVSGENNATFSIALPASAVISAGGGNTMTVNAFTSNPLTVGTLSGTGTLTLLVGGTLTVGATQVAGSYTGSFSVTVDYN